MLFTKSRIFRFFIATIVPAKCFRIFKKGYRNFHYFYCYIFLFLKIKRYNNKKMSLYDDEYAAQERVQTSILNCALFDTKDENMCKLISEKCTELDETLKSEGFRINIESIKKQIQELYDVRLSFFNKKSPTLLIIALYIINHKTLSLRNRETLNLLKHLDVSKFDVARYMYLLNEVYSRTSSIQH
jgi:hypothetical protein